MIHVTTTKYSNFMLDLFLIFAYNHFLFHASVTTIYWTSIELLLNLVASLDSGVPSLDFEQVDVILTSSFDSVSILFDSLVISKRFLVLCFSPSISFSNVELINIWFTALIPLTLHSFRLWFARCQQNGWIVLLTRFCCFFFWLWANHCCSFY